MKKIKTNTKKSLMFYLSIAVIFGLLWACAEEDPYNPGIQPPEITEVEPPAAFPTQEVVIYGKNFSSAAAENAVSFNGIAATVTGTTTLAITTTVPEGATSGEVTVTSNNMTSAGMSFTVTEPVIPTITSIEPTTGKVGTEVIITGTKFSTEPGRNIVSFNDTEANVTASTETSITTSVPAGATTGNVTVTVDGESNGVMFTVIEANMLVVAIDKSEDDAEEGALNGKLTTTSSDLELGEYDTWTQDGVAQGLQTIGLKFDGITIPKGSVILAATLQFTSDNTGADPVQLTVYGENNSTPESYSEDIFYHITTRAKTLANVVWDVPEWAKSGLNGPDQATPDIAAVVQEIVDRDDWVSGSSMAFILEHSGPSIGVESSSGGREAEAIDGTAATELTIIYE